MDLRKTTAMLALVLTVGVASAGAWAQGRFVDAEPRPLPAPGLGGQANPKPLPIPGKDLDTRPKPLPELEDGVAPRGPARELPGGGGPVNPRPDRMGSGS